MSRGNWSSTMRFGGCEITLKILYASVVVTYLFIVFSVWPKLILESLERISQVCFKLIWHILRQCESFNHSSSTLLAAMCQEAQRIISLFLSLWRPVQWWPLVVDGCKHLFPVHSREHVATCKLAKEVLVCCSDHPGNLVINYHRFIDHHTSSQWSPHRNFLRTWVAPPAPPAPRAPRLPVVHRLPGGRQCNSIRGWFRLGLGLGPAGDFVYYIRQYIHLMSIYVHIMSLITWWLIKDKLSWEKYSNYCNSLWHVSIDAIDRSGDPLQPL